MNGQCEKAAPRGQRSNPKRLFAFRKIEKLESYTATLFCPRRPQLQRMSSDKQLGTAIPGAGTNGRPIVFIDVSIGDQPAGRIKMELFSDIVPK
jgi:hypothetical protein